MLKSFNLHYLLVFAHFFFVFDFLSLVGGFDLVRKIEKNEKKCKKALISDLR